MLMANDALLAADPNQTRDYISTMAGELAQLARQTGDARLALLLDAAASFAEVCDRAPR